MDWMEVEPGHIDGKLGHIGARAGDRNTLARLGEHFLLVKTHVNFLGGQFRLYAASPAPHHRPASGFPLPSGPLRHLTCSSVGKGGS